jgi:hypothetical protein
MTQPQPYRILNNNPVKATARIQKEQQVYIKKLAALQQQSSQLVSALDDAIHQSTGGNTN